MHVNDVISYETELLGTVWCVASRLQELPVGALLVDWRYRQDTHAYGFVYQVVTRSCAQNENRWLYVWDLEDLHATGRADVLNDLTAIAALADEGDDTDRYTGGFYSFDPWDTLMLHVVESDNPAVQSLIDWLDEQRLAAAPA